ncbi:MAG: DMT family transporter [Bacteroidota bacterium]|jgi:drug/metabolite transporter (DMT)-like permease|nr:DMT family transporter [Bacteroidia bacterium]HRS38624.1 DMT family transporter [Bacteroidia bacterium]
MSTRFRSHAAIFAANLIYGANFSIAKIAMPHYIRPAGFILLRVGFALLLFRIVEWATRTGSPVERKDHWRFFLLGLFGVAINQSLFFEGLSRTSNINAALIMTTTPILVMIAASLIIGERITTRRVVGVASGITGAAGLILLGVKASGHASWLGDTMVFTNAVSYAIYMVMAKPMMRKYHPWAVIRWTFFYGFLLVIPLGLKDVASIEWSTFSTPVWLSTVYVILFTTFFAYLLNTYGLQHLSPSVVSFYIYFQPLFATGISLLIAQETVSWIQAGACVLIFLGVYLVAGPVRRKPEVA